MLRRGDPQQFISCFLRNLLIISSFAHIIVLVDATGTAQRPGEHDNSVHNIGLGPGAKDMDMATWSALKNSEVGPTISPRLTERGAWRPDPQPKLVAEPIPGLSVCLAFGSIYPPKKMRSEVGFGARPLFHRYC